MLFTIHNLNKTFVIILHYQRKSLKFIIKEINLNLIFSYSCIGSSY